MGILEILNNPNNFLIKPVHFPYDKIPCETNNGNIIFRYKGGKKYTVTTLEQLMQVNRKNQDKTYYCFIKLISFLNFLKYKVKENPSICKKEHDNYEIYISIPYTIMWDNGKIKLCNRTTIRQGSSGKYEILCGYDKSKIEEISKYDIPNYLLLKYNEQKENDLTELYTFFLLINTKIPTFVYSDCRPPSNIFDMYNSSEKVLIDFIHSIKAKYKMDLHEQSPTRLSSKMI
jgi:hypothetical protein